MPAIDVFRPAAAANTKNLSVTTSSDRVQLQTKKTAVNVRVHNAGSVTAFINFGGASVTASATTGMPVPPGAVEIVVMENLYVAAITGASTTTLYFTPGIGA